MEKKFAIYLDALPNEYEVHLDDESENGSMAKRSAENAALSEAYAKGTVNGTPVASGEAGYHDNSKYYRDQAHEWAKGSTDSAAMWAVGNVNETPSSTNNAKYYASKANDAADFAEASSGLSAFATEALSGYIVATKLGADNVPMKSYVAEIVPYQSGSGNPTPDNQRPFVGATQMNVYRYGKNMIPFGTETATKHGAAVVDGSNLRVTNTENDTYSGVNYYQSYYYTVPLAGRVLTLSCDIVVNSGVASFGLRYREGASAYNFVTGASRTKITTSGHYSITFTTSSDRCYLSFLCTDTVSEAGDVEYNNLQLEAGAAETAAENGVASLSIVIPFGDAGTVYGGYLDVLNGILTVTRKRFAVSVSGSTTPPTVLGTYTRFWAYVGPGYVTGQRGMLCDVMEYDATGYNEDRLGFIAFPSNSPTSCVFKMPKSLVGETKQTIDDYLALHPIECVAELSTPLTYQLTTREIRSLLGTNTFLSDTGGVEVEVRCDPTLYIDSKIAALAASIA